jgi:hypothetical protein
VAPWDDDGTGLKYMVSLERIEEKGTKVTKQRVRGEVGWVSAFTLW